MEHSPSRSLAVPPRPASSGRAAARAVVWVRGEQDVATRPALTVAIADAARADGASVLVDLSHVTFMDASTVGAIVAGRNRLRSRGQSLDVRAPSPAAFRVLELCGLTNLIARRRVRPSRRAARRT